MGEGTKIRIAISGGGIAGATLLHALVQHSHLDIHIFEAATAFREGGASLGIPGNAMKAFELIGSSAAQCVGRAGAFPLSGLTIRMAVGETQKGIVGEVGHKGRGFLRSVGRAALLHELLKIVPAERMHTSKKLEKVRQEAGGPLELLLYVDQIIVNGKLANIRTISLVRMGAHTTAIFLSARTVGNRPKTGSQR